MDGVQAESSQQLSERALASRGRPRGRPRSEAARRRILDATHAILMEQGFHATTIEAIAARAGVGKATIYKWWPSLGFVALESLFDRTRSGVVVDPDRSVRDELEAQLDALLHLFRDTRTGPLIREVIAIAATDADVHLALHQQWFMPRRQIVEDLLSSAISDGIIRPNVALDLVTDQLFAPLYHRLTTQVGPLSDDLPARLVNQLWAGIACPSSD